eukprot:5641128-Karenia_brevis.AAC.1
MVRLDRNEHHMEKADRAEKALISGNMQDMHRAVHECRPWRPHKRTPAKRFRRICWEGVATGTYERERAVVREHFASLLEAEPMEFQKLLKIEKDDHYQTVVMGQQPPREAIEFPTVPDTQRILHSGSRGKAYGEDLQADEQFHVCNPQLADLLHPVATKAFASVRPPLQYRGGMLVELYKGAGDQTSMKAYRDITLGNYSGKSFAKWIRHKIQPALTLFTAFTQWGSGLHGGDTNVAHLQLRVYMEIASTLRLTFAATFLDISTAFASLVRHLSVPVDAGDEIWLRSLRQVGFTTQEVDAIYTELTKDLWGPHGASEIAVANAAAMRKMTW